MYSIPMENRFKGDLEKYKVPTREEMISRIENEENFDILVIGSGATGAGIALDASTRGLKVALFEMNSFCGGTSSRTTKMAHGGVRYLQKALKTLDWKTLEFVYDALKERKHFLEIAPHLVSPLTIRTPCFSWISALQNYILLKVYDFLSVFTSSSVGRSKWISKKETLKDMILLKNKTMKGSVSYVDVQFHDSRMCLSLAITASCFGSVVLNHNEVIGILKNEKNKAIGLKVHDKISNVTRNVYGKVIINASGYLSDIVRKMDDENLPKLIHPSAGVHVVLDKKFSPGKNTSMLIPYTTDGRVMFVLNYEDKCIAGTTEGFAELKPHPGPTQKSIETILKNLNLCYNVNITKNDILSAWAGVRPLVKDPNVKKSAGLSRDHYISVSHSGITTICGGKWTTFARMSFDVLEKVIALFNITTKRSSQAYSTVLIGAESMVSRSDTERKLIDSFPNFFKDEKNREIAEHLVHFYGDKAFEILEIAKTENLFQKLDPNYSFIEAEVVYQCRKEFALEIYDVIATRLSILFLDVPTTLKIIPRISELMQQELKWTNEKMDVEKERVLKLISKTTFYGSHK